MIPSLYADCWTTADPHNNAFIHFSHSVHLLLHAPWGLPHVGLDLD
jgi:hypothetical protein